MMEDEKIARALRSAFGNCDLSDDALWLRVLALVRVLDGDGRERALREAEALAHHCAKVARSQPSPPPYGNLEFWIGKLHASNEIACKIGALLDGVEFSKSGLALSEALVVAVESDDRGPSFLVDQSAAERGMLPS